MDARAAYLHTLAPAGCPAKTSSSSLPARERVNAHHQRRDAAEQVSNLDRLGDLGFRGARGASVVGEGPDTGRYAANAPTRTSDETRAGSAALRGPQIKLG